MKNIILATNNLHKLQEFSNGLNQKILSLNDLNIKDFNPLENGDTFEENAMIKAKALESILKQNNINKQMIILADDSGLCIEALDNAPGVVSARYANVINNNNIQSNSSDSENRKAVIKMLKNKQLWGSKAYFKCSIAFIFYNLDSNQHGVISDICKGIVAIKEIGNEGFGYDCMFYRDFISNKNILDSISFNLENIQFLESLSHSLATISLEEKMKISHRGKAIRKLKNILGV